MKIRTFALHSSMSIILALAFFGISPGSASAATGDLGCELQTTITFNPALTAGATVHTVNSAGLTACTSPNGHYSDLYGGTASGPGIATAAPGADPCSLVFTTSGSNARIDWNTGKVSYFNFRTNTNPSAGTIQTSSQVTSGLLKGDSIQNVPVVAAVNPDCAVNGLKWVSLPVTENIFS